MGIFQKLLYGFIKFCLILFFIPQYSCNTTEPPTPPDEPTPELTLELEDVSCTESWINLTTKDLTLPAELTLKQYNPTGDSILKSLILNTQDTLLYIDSLLPNQTYQYLVSSIQHQASSIKSNELSVTTLDTTSHNFTFQTWTFGTIGSSTLYDVAIIDENNIIAVGEIMVADSSPNGYTTYNAVHWDGNQWELLRIPYRDFGNHIVYGPLRTVLAFSATDIWFCSYADLVHFDGSNYISKAFFMTGSNFNGQVSKMWGTDKNNIYCVGRSGAIYHYNGTAWKKIESGTDLNINDIWGDYSEKTGEWEILAVSGNILHGFEQERAILKIVNGTQVVKLNPEGAKWPLSGIWFKPKKKYYAVGSGIYNKHSLDDLVWNNNLINITSFHTNKIKGNNINDITIVGAYGETLHFNGLTWKSYINETFLSNGTYLSVGIKNNLIIAVGYQSAQAVITIGQR